MRKWLYRLRGIVRPGWMRRYWLDALESGEFKQCRHVLRQDNAYCCLGVACEVYRRETGVGEWNEFDEWADNPFSNTLPIEVRCALGVGSSNPAAEGLSATAMNDSAGLTFPEIAASFRREWGMPQ